MISLEEARSQRRCRICGEAIKVPAGPAGWEDSFGKLTYPVRVVLNYGKEFAHPNCLYHGIEEQEAASTNNEA